jgi:hypothetical protein
LLSAAVWPFGKAFQLDPRQQDSAEYSDNRGIRVGAIMMDFILVYTMLVAASFIAATAAVKEAMAPPAAKRGHVAPGDSAWRPPGSDQH